MNERAPNSRSPSREIALGNLKLNFESYGIQVDDRSVDLSAREFDLLRLMVDNLGRVLPYRVFTEALWLSSDKRMIRALNVQMHRLRQKIRGSCPYTVKTVRMRGYGLVEGTSLAADEKTS
jgi:DNA-binding response OmpR family regulator